MSEQWYFFVLETNLPYIGCMSLNLAATMMVLSIFFALITTPCLVFLKFLSSMRIPLFIQFSLSQYCFNASNITTGCLNLGSVCKWRNRVVEFHLTIISHFCIQLVHQFIGRDILNVFYFHNQAFLS